MMLQAALKSKVEGHRGGGRGFAGDTRARPVGSRSRIWPFDNKNPI